MFGRYFLYFTTLCTIACPQTVFAQYHDLSPILLQMQDLQNKSIQLSPFLKVIRNQISQKKAESYTRFSDFLPKANLSLKKEKDFFEGRNAPLRALGIGPADSTWSIDYQWNLLNYGIIEASRKTLAEKDKVLLELLSKEKEYPITYKTNLLNYLLAKYKKAAVENSLKKAEAGKKEARLGFELGQKTKLDVLRSEANMVSLDSKKVSFADEEQNAKSKFIEYSGLENSDLDFLENLEESSIFEVLNTISLSVRSKSLPLFNKSPLLQSLKYDEEINNITLSYLTQAEWPNLKLQGSYNNSGDSFSDSLHSPYRSHTIALVLTIPIFGGGSLISTNFEEYFAKQQIKYSMAQKKLEIQNNLNNSLIKMNALETLVASLTLNVSQYEELYRLTNKSYQLGKSTLMELLEVQDNLLDSKINLAQNKIQFFTLSQNYLWQAGLQ
jgi:outer membrane protein TolC